MTAQDWLNRLWSPENHDSMLEKLKQAEAIIKELLK